MNRPMTPMEKLEFRGYFPNLNVNQAVVTGDATWAYNCIAWTVGVTNAWLWPGPSIQNFDSFYSRYGFRRAANGPIAAWSNGRMTHGCISGPGHGPRWESKCGALLRIQHGLNELVSSSYGRVVAFYGRRRALPAEVRELIENINSGMPSAMPTPDQIAAIRAASAQLPDELRARFEEAFTAWKATWLLPHLAISSDPSSVTHNAEFHRLVSLGSETLPAVVEKLLEPNNFFALQLYDVLQPQHHMTLTIDPESDEIFEGEQGRARRTAERFATSLPLPR